MDCRICLDALHKNNDDIVLCEHKNGFVHLGCCTNNCSWHGSPCDHAVSKYEKVHRTAELFNWMNQK